MPTAPNARPILLASMVVAVIAAVFAALAADRIAQAFDTRHAVRERLGTTILGEIPKFARQLASCRWSRCSLMGRNSRTGHHGVRDHSYQRRVPSPRSTSTCDLCHLIGSSCRQVHRCGWVELCIGETRSRSGRGRGRSPSADACRATRYRTWTRSGRSVRFWIDPIILQPTCYTSLRVSRRGCRSGVPPM